MSWTSHAVVPSLIYTVHEGVRRLVRRLADSPGRFERSESRASGTESNSNNPLGVPESRNIRHNH
jgi:hypothetical protein